MPISALGALWMVPALPLLGFLVNGALALWRPHAETAVSAIGVGVLVLACAAAVAAVAGFAGLHPAAPLVFRYWEWMPVGDLRIDFALQLDQLSAVMVLVVTGVGALIHVFSVGYMHEDAGYARYFAYLNLFVFFMLVLVLGASFPVMFVGWEGVGLCSYLLIGFWFAEQANANAGRKAFIMNRIGDLGFMVAMFIIFWTTGSLDFETVFAHALTALFAATIALKQWDIKKVLAYSTVSQLGYMFVAVGTGAMTAGIFHLATHAFFKALLFLGSGSVIYAMHHAYHATHSHEDAQDMRNMGGLARYLPWTTALMWIATLAIAGIPPLSGFFSKDEILTAAFARGTTNPAWLVFWVFGLAAALLTAFYMTRLMLYTFHGPNRTGEKEREHLHEAPWIMTGPLLVLGILSAAGGLLNVPELYHGSARLHHWLEPITQPGAAMVPEAHLSTTTEWMLVGVAVLIAVLGMVGAWRLLNPAALVPARDAPAERGFARILRHKWYVDEIYDALIVRPLVWLSTEILWKRIDQQAIDGATVNGVARGARALGWANRWLQTGQVGVYVGVFVVGVLLIIWRAVG